jgi:uncharacterized membrane protein YhaH (DUF805 family)
VNWSHILFSFEGRINRAKWWLAVIITIILTAIIDVLTKLVNGPFIAGILYLAISVLTLWIGFAAGAKRLHDRDKSAAWLWLFYGFPFLMSLILAVVAGAAIFDIIMAPEQAGQSEAARVQVVIQALSSYGLLVGIVGLAALAIGIWAFIWFGCLRGTMGPNRFGPDPLAGYVQPYGGQPQQPYPPPGQVQPPAR